MAGDRSSAHDVPCVAGTRTGAFGFIRLALAALVVIGHAPELLDGNRLREPLTRVFGTLSLGEVAVDGFFLVSGFLVTGSWLRASDTGAYLMRRVARIYPGFLVAFAVSLLLVGPLGGGSLAKLGAAGLVVQSLAALSLLQPALPGAFAGLPHPALDGAMWTIGLELRCYILVIVLGTLGVLRRPWLLAGLAAGCFALYHGLPHTAFDAAQVRPFFRMLVVDPFNFSRLAGHFLVGALWLQLWPRGGAQPWTIAMAAIGLVVGLSIGALAEPAMAVFGGFLILAASRTRFMWLQCAGERSDLSYGLYLYAWPIMNLTILWVPGIAPGPLALGTLTAAFACGWASWHLVEAPASRWMQRRLSMARARSTASENLLPA